MPTSPAALVSARTLVCGFALAAAVAFPALADPLPSAATPLVAGDAPELVPMQGFRFELAVDVPVPPLAAYDAFTRDLPQWWDHTLAGDPSALSLDARPAGGFVELFPQGGDAGPDDGARHATVTLADRGRRLVFIGQLGLVGQAFLGIHDLRFEPLAGDAPGTRVTLVASGMGLLEPGTEDVVHQVWQHFLVERYEAFVEGR